MVKFARVLQFKEVRVSIPRKHLQVLFMDDGQIDRETYQKVRAKLAEIEDAQEYFSHVASILRRIALRYTPTCTYRMDTCIDKSKTRYLYSEGGADAHSLTE